jgi:CubicO group peptidase (beta-lactamase class C family)
MAHTGVSYLAPLVPQRAAGYAQTFDGYTNAPHIGVTPAGGLYSTLGDLYAFDRALYGDTLVNERSKALLFALRSVITAYGWKTSEDTLQNGTRRRVLRTSGGLPGFEALMVRVPEARRTIILLSNARTRVSRFDDFAIAIGRILDGRSYSMPKRSVAEAIAGLVNAGRNATVVAREFDAIRADTARFALSEREMNDLGYFYVSRGASSRAVDIFTLNVRAFPRSANVYDSLGEAQLARGDTALAIASYRRSLELDPGNTNASNVLSRIVRKP